jgi:hypothetical protein
MHTISSPPPDGGGGSLVASPNSARATFSWTPPHDMPPAMQIRRTERAERKRLEIEAMLNAPAGEEAHVE